MAQIPNIENLTIAAEEVRDLREVIARAIYQDPNWLSLHNVVDGISKKTQILLDDSSGNAGWKATGCAAVQSGGMSIKLAEKYWEPVTIEDMIDYCQADLNVNFKPLVIRNAKDKFGDLSDQEAINVFISASVERFIKESAERLAWLADTEADNLSEGSYIKDTVNPKFYTPLDGIWKQIFDAKTAGTLTAFTNVAANEQATKALQLSTMDDDAAFAIVKAVYDAAPDPLKLDPAAYIWVTPAMYNQYKNYLAANTLSGGGIAMITIEGIPTPTYMGVPLKTSLLVGQKIRTDMEVSDGASPEVLTYNLPHRAVMATPDLLPAATTNTEDIEALESFFVQLERKSYIRFDYALDVKVVRPDMISVAY